MTRLDAGGGRQMPDDLRKTNPANGLREVTKIRIFSKSSIAPVWTGAGVIARR